MKSQGISREIGRKVPRESFLTGQGCDVFARVAPHPRVWEELKAQMKDLHKRNKSAFRLVLKDQRRPGFNDGVIYPGNLFPLGTSAAPVKRAAADRTPLKGTVRAVVVLVQFPDKKMTGTKKHFSDLLFSTGQLPHGSMKEYYREVSNNTIDLVGEVVGPYTLPRKLTEYAHGASACGETPPNGQTMARDAAELADKDVHFAPYDNDRDGFVDAFIIVHAGPGAEELPLDAQPDNIWSHKCVLDGDPYITRDGTKIFAYDTVPDDASVGVCCHELGHLLFGWPDLYDTDNMNGESEGLGNWCLMAAGSWCGSSMNGDVPCHPCGFLKAQQGWVTVKTPKTNAKVSLEAVENSHQIWKLWKNGKPGKEYFLLENRQKALFDQYLPGAGLLIFHVDENISGNDDANHYMVDLEEANGNEDLEQGTNRGDPGDPYPGSSRKKIFTAKSDPSSKSYGDLDTCVAVTEISDSAKTMTANIEVMCKTKPK